MIYTSHDTHDTTHTSHDTYDTRHTRHIQKKSRTFSRAAQVHAKLLNAAWSFDIDVLDIYSLFLTFAPPGALPPLAAWLAQARPKLLNARITNSAAGSLYAGQLQLFGLRPATFALAILPSLAKPGSRYGKKCRVF